MASRVKDLIKSLQEQDPEAEVLVRTGDTTRAINGIIVDPRIKRSTGEDGPTVVLSGNYYGA